MLVAGLATGRRLRRSEQESQPKYNVLNSDRFVESSGRWRSDKVVLLANRAAANARPVDANTRGPRRLSRTCEWCPGTRPRCSTRTRCRGEPAIPNRALRPADAKMPRLAPSARTRESRSRKGRPEQPSARPCRTADTQEWREEA